IIGLVHVRVDAKRSLLQAPVFPHANTVMRLAVFALDGDGARQFKHVPDLIDPRPDADNDIVTSDFAFVRQKRGNGGRIAAKLEALDFETGHDAYTLGLGFRGKTIDRGGVVRVAAL